MPRFCCSCNLISIKAFLTTALFFSAYSTHCFAENSSFEGAFWQYACKEIDNDAESPIYFIKLMLIFFDVDACILKLSSVLFQYRCHEGKNLSFHLQNDAVWFYRLLLLRYE